MMLEVKLVTDLCMPGIWKDVVPIHKSPLVKNMSCSFDDPYFGALNSKATKALRQWKFEQLPWGQGESTSRFVNRRQINDYNNNLVRRGRTAYVMKRSRRRKETAAETACTEKPAKDETLKLNGFEPCIRELLQVTTHAGDNCNHSLHEAHLCFGGSEHWNETCLRSFEVRMFIKFAMHCWRIRKETVPFRNVKIHSIHKRVFEYYVSGESRKRARRYNKNEYDPKYDPVLGVKRKRIRSEQSDTSASGSSGSDLKLECKVKEECSSPVKSDPPSLSSVECRMS